MRVANVVCRTIAAGCMSVVGCAQLSVQVDILDQGYWLSPEWLVRDRAAKIQQMHYEIVGGSFERRLEGMKQGVNRAVDEMSSGDRAVIAKETKEVVLRLVVQKIDDGVGKEFTEARDGVRAAYEKLLLPESPHTKREDSVNQAWQLYQPAAGKLRALPQKLSNLETELSGDLRRVIVPPGAAQDAPASIAATKVTEVLKTKTEEAKKAVRGLIGDKGIFTDPFASAVVNAPDAYWEGEFNKTYGCGSFGNIDIAIKMEDVANFTVKGVRNDAAAITRAMFAVGQQAVQTVAALYGIPLPKGGASQPAGDGQAPTPIEVPDFESPQTRLAEVSAQESDLRRARAALFESLISQRERLAVDAQRPQAIESLKDAVNNFEGVTKE